MPDPVGPAAQHHRAAQARCARRARRARRPGGLAAVDPRRCSASSTTSTASSRRSSANCGRSPARDERAKLLMTIPGVAELLALTIAAEIGDISRFPSARKLVGYAGLAPRVKQSGQSSHTGRLSKAGPGHAALGRRRSLPARLAADQPLARALHRHQAPPRQGQPRQVRRRPQGPHRRLAHPLAQRAVQAQRHRAPPILSRQAPPFVWPPDGPQTI